VSVGEKARYKQYVDTCAMLARCAEEHVYLLEEAEDAAEYFANKAEKLTGELLELQGAAPHSKDSGVVMILQYELACTQALCERMTTTQAKLRSLLSDGLDDTPQTEDEIDPLLTGVDSDEVLPIEEDADESDPTDSGYNTSDGVESEGDGIDEDDILVEGARLI